MKYKLSLFNMTIKEMSDGVYYYNTLSKAILLLSREIVDKLSSGKINELSESIQIKLFQNGYLVKEDLDELSILQNAYQKSHSQSNFVSIVLVPTFACNFSCNYCFEGEKPLFSGQEIENYFQSLKEFARKEFVSKNHVHLSMFGGEPLLAYDYFKDFFIYLSNLSKEFGFQYSSSLTTNGYLLTEAMASEMLTLFNLESVQITLDGNEATHNSVRTPKNGEKTFFDIISNFKKLLHLVELCGSKCDIKLRINLINNTLEDIAQTLNLFSEKDKKLFSIYFRPVYNTKFFNVENENKSNLKDFYHLANQKGFRFTFGDAIKFSHCEGDGGIDQFFIIPDLTVWKCINDFSEVRAKIGHIGLDGTFYIDRDSLSHWTKNNPFNSPTCKSCKWLPICWGGCPLQYSKSKSHICMYEKAYNLIDTILLN